MTKRIRKMIKSNKIRKIKRMKKRRRRRKTIVKIRKKSQQLRSPRLMTGMKAKRSMKLE